MSVCPAAASAALIPVLTGAPRAVEVMAATPAAVYLATGDPSSPAICLCTPAAVRVPCALLTPGPLRVDVGDRGLAGSGAVLLAGREYRVARWWSPPRFGPGGSGCGLVGLGAVLGERLSDPLPAAKATALADLIGLLGAASRDMAVGRSAGLRAVVAGLLGWGPGLTPVADDVLAGMLVTLIAGGSAAARPLGAALADLAPDRTTFVSAALLHSAGRGECIPELAAVLRDRPGALDALLRVGHSSGPGLAWGVHRAAPLVPSIEGELAR
jgi:hypothetical protein